MRAVFFVSFLFMSTCSQPESEWVYVSGAGYASEVKISLPATARVGEEVVLEGQRTSGPWRSAKRTEVREGEGVVLWTREPPGKETGVSVTGNLRWDVHPSGSAIFGMDGMSERTVKFSAPGKYRVQGFSAFPTQAVSNEVEILVRDQ